MADDSKISAPWLRWRCGEPLAEHPCDVEAWWMLTRAMLDADPSVIFVRDRARRFVFVNKAAAALIGLTPEEVVRQSAEVTHGLPEEMAGHDWVDRQVLETGQPVQLEERFTTADGTVRWLHTQKRPLVAPDGETYVLGVAIDVTARRLAERELAEAQRHLELALTAGQLGLWDWSLRDGTVYFSPSWKTQLGYAPDELDNSFETWRGLIHPDDVAPAMKVLQTHLDDPDASPRYINEFRLRTKSGAYLWIASYSLIIRDEQGVPARAMGCHVDIQSQRQYRSQLEASNEQLAQAARMKDEFLANMSHELRTPLTAILGQSEALADGLLGPITDVQREALSTIDESGQHLLSLINDVLDVAKINAGYLELSPSRLSVDALCQESLRLIHEQARRKDIQVTYSRDLAVEDLVADRRRLKQVLVNLLHNAQKFTPEGGEIGLKVGRSQEDGGICFTVWDTGVGIDASIQSQLFEPFVQLDSGLNRVYEGTGLGLALVSKLVALHGGEISLESAVGQGSRFTVRLPAAPTEALPPEPPGGQSLEDERALLNAFDGVLIAYERPQRVQHVRVYLESQGVSTRIAEDPEAALAQCEVRWPELLILDTQMLGEEAPSFVRALRASAGRRPLRIVAVIPPKAGCQASMMASGADACVQTPLTVRGLLHALRSLNEAVNH